MQVYEDHNVAAALRLPLMNLDRTLGLVEAFCLNTHKRLNTPSPEPKIGLFGSQHPKIFLKTAVFRGIFDRNVARRRPWRNAGPGETVTAGHVPVSHQDVGLFIRSFADLGSESSSARKIPRSRKDTSTVTPSESDSAVRARPRYAGTCKRIRSYP